MNHNQLPIGSNCFGHFKKFEHLNLLRISSFGLGILAFSLLGTSLSAQNVERISEQEIARRQAALPRGDEALALGRVAMKDQNFMVAHEQFRVAVTFLFSGESRVEAVDGFCKSGVMLAKQKIAEAKYSEAEAIALEILDERYDPNCHEAQELIRNLRTPGYYNRTIGPKFIAKVEDVKKLLAEAEGYYQSGRYDLAFKKYDQVLTLDPYNSAARRGQEKIDHTKFQYGEDAYNESRGRALWQVQKGWEQPVRSYGPGVGPLADAFAKDVTGTAKISNKLSTIIIPRIEFRDASIREAIDFIRQQAAANDPSTEGHKGVDIVLRLTPIGQMAPPSSAPVQPVAPPPPAATGPAGAAAPGELVPPPAATPIPATVITAPAISPGDARITITLNQIPLGEALRYISSQAGLKVKVEPYAVAIIPISEQTQDLITKEYKVPPGFLTATLNAATSNLNAPAHTVGGGGTAKDTVESTGGRSLVNRETAKDFLEAQGVSFEIKGSGAQFLPQSSRLVVRNTPDQLELVDAIVEQASVAGPKQVEIEAKFVEITQNNLKELGFDWLLGQFNIGNHKVFGGGGTSGAITGPGVPAGSPDFPFAPPGGAPVGQFPVTSGNRSGSMAISANAIDALLFPTMGASAIAPAIFGLSGVFTDPQFQVVIRALNQKKGVDLLSAPRLTTKSGQRAVIEVVREFRYPTQFQPPQIPQTVGSTSGSAGGAASIPVTPTTPTAFETRNTGVTLEVEPVVGPDGLTIDLNLVPQVVDFEGFINYGSPILAPATGPSLTVLGGIIFTLPGSPASVITPNVINQPIFSSRKVTTSVSVWDGQTVVLGGLIREDVQKTEDRTPILGDIPVVGRLFRTNVDQHIKRNLIIFVSARLVNPAGMPLNNTEEEEEKEELIQPPTLPEVPMYKK
ncbi:MAG TPA: Amuc_1098 family type IV pilus outer membrane protein [Chthoniobacterales bacterium]